MLLYPRRPIGAVKSSDPLQGIPFLILTQFILIVFGEVFSDFKNFSESAGKYPDKPVNLNTAPWLKKIARYVSKK
jgi:hypothetical protein